MTTQAQNKIFKHIKHVGKRPKDDHDNQCREKLCTLVRNVGCFHEICPQKLYLVYLAENENSKLFCESYSRDPNCPFIFWTFYDYPHLSYEAFNMDFGPFNLATTHQFLSRLKVWLDTQAFREPDKYIAIVLEDHDVKRKLNITLLVAIAAMVLLNLTDEEVIQRLDFFMVYKEKAEGSKKLFFHETKKFTDVSGSHSLMSLTLEDCIKSFYAALQLKFYDYFEFDPTEYLFYETVQSGDLNWIVPNKILAFAGPSDKPVNSKIYFKHPPKFYYHYFKDHNVSSIVRLNDAEYESSGFTDLGFKHHDLIFPDGYPPTSPIAAQFIKIVDEAKGAVAVHCYAGIGRTGTLIAAYLMARYNFTPQMAIAWTRICRPGSVIGDQQDWLFTKFDSLSINRSSLKTPKKNKSGTSVESVKVNFKSDKNLKTTYAVAEKTYGQAKALLLAKKQRDEFERPCTRNSSLLDSSPEGDEFKKLTKKTDIVLDLGKTIPLMFQIDDFRGSDDVENPEIYRLKDGKYEWKVKFPEPGYVALKRNFKLKDLPTEITSCERRFIEPLLSFRYEHTKKLDSSNKLINGEKTSLPRSKPVVYYDITAKSEF